MCRIKNIQMIVQTLTRIIVFTHCYYVTYILYFQFDEINNLVDYFRDSPLWCKLIINKIFADTIYLQKIMRQGHIDINEYPHIIKLFEKETRRIYL